MEENISDSGEVGRPKGSPKLRASFRKWQPKTWKVEYEAICLMHAKGFTNIEVAELTEYTEVHVGNIINCELGQKFLQRVRDNIAISTRTLEEKYKDILEKSVDRLDRFMRKDELFEKYPIQAVDRAMKSMEMIDSRLRANSANKTNNTVVLATEANVDRLLNAMNKSKQSDELHGLTQISSTTPEPIDLTTSRDFITTGSK